MNNFWRFSAIYASSTEEHFFLNPMIKLKQKQLKTAPAYLSESYRTKYTLEILIGTPTLKSACPASNNGSIVSLHFSHLKSYTLYSLSPDIQRGTFHKGEYSRYLQTW